MAYNNYNTAYPAIPYNGYNGAQGPAYPYQQASSGAYYPAQGTPTYPYHQAPAVPPPLMPAMQGRQNNMILDWVQGPEAASAYYCCPCMQPRNATYLVDFGADIAVPDGGTAGAISLAIAIDGVTIPSSIMTVTPADIEEYFNVSRAINADIWRNCCETVSVRNVSDQPILVSNANIIFSRPDLAVTR